MSAATRTEMPLVGVNGGEQYEERTVEWGDFEVTHSQFPAMNLAPFLKGLPDDLCQCPHWGFLFKGKLIVRYGEREETITGGQSFYMPPGHAPESLEDCEILQFSPLDEQRRTEAAIARNMAAMQGC